MRAISILTVAAGVALLMGAGSWAEDKPAPAATELGGWRAPEEARGVPNPIAAGEESVARGAAIYRSTCLGCHGADGHGDGKMAKGLSRKPADIVHRIPAQSDGELFWKITEGRRPMPSFEKDLEPEQRWDVINYLRHLVAASASPDSAATMPDSVRAKATPKAAMYELE